MAQLVRTHDHFTGHSALRCCRLLLRYTCMTFPKRGFSFIHEHETEIKQVEEGTLENALKQQTKGHFIKASEEQILALSSQHIEAAGIGDSVESRRVVFNLLNKEPSVCNNYGRLHEVDADDFQQLKDMDIKISYVNITQVHIHNYLIAHSFPTRMSYSEFCIFREE